MAKIYSVKWEDGNGEQGYFVKMGAAAAKKLDAFLKKEEAHGTIKDPAVWPIEGEWLLTPKQFHAEFMDRYHDED